MAKVAPSATITVRHSFRKSWNWMEDPIWIMAMQMVILAKGSSPESTNRVRGMPHQKEMVNKVALTRNMEMKAFVLSAMKSPME